MWPWQRIEREYCEVRETRQEVVFGFQKSSDGSLSGGGSKWDEGEEVTKEKSIPRYPDGGTHHQPHELTSSSTFLIAPLDVCLYICLTIGRGVIPKQEFNYCFLKFSNYYPLHLRVLVYV